MNWYRAMKSNLLTNQEENVSLEIITPTLFLWGNQDEAVGRVAIESMDEFMKGSYKSIELEAGHWLLVDKTERVINEILVHINGFNKVVSTVGSEPK